MKKEALKIIDRYELIYKMLIRMIKYYKEKHYTREEINDLLLYSYQLKDKDQAKAKAKAKRIKRIKRIIKKIYKKV